MISRRGFLSGTAAGAVAGFLPGAFAASASTMDRKQRVDLALAGQPLDRPPYTLWHHFNKPTAQEEAQYMLDFHRQYDTDIVKVMNDFSYPASSTGKWYQLKPLSSPYPKQLETLEYVRKGLQGEAYFIDTLYGPHMTALHLLGASPEFAGKNLSEDQVGSQLQIFQRDNPQGWADMMEVITQSTVNHIKQARQIGVSGALVSIFNATSKFNSVADYEQYSRPYDKRVLDALSGTKLTVLHLHYLERPYLAEFHDFYAPVINYSVTTSGIPVADVRKLYAQTIAGGVDEIHFNDLSVGQIREQWTTARREAGNKYIITPGCSVPNSSTPEALARLRASIVS
jgi:uroporphyrinogen decarboxylase